MIRLSVTLVRHSLNSNRLLETIRCEAGEPQHLVYHQQRLDFSLKRLGYTITYSLEELISPPDKGLYRCRFIYDQTGYLIEYHPYQPRAIQTLKLIHSDINYSLKFADRTQLDHLFALKEAYDDVLIVRNGLLTDTSIANIALYIDDHWLTPKFPLLAGTTRSRLLDTRKIFTAALHVNDLKKASKIALMNAMMGFVELENGIIT